MKLLNGCVLTTAHSVFVSFDSHVEWLFAANSKCMAIQTNELCHQ